MGRHAAPALLGFAQCEPRTPHSPAGPDRALRGAGGKLGGGGALGGTLDGRALVVSRLLGGALSGNSLGGHLCEISLGGDSCGEDL